MKGSHYIYETLLPSYDSYLLHIISEKLASEKNHELEKCLITQNQNSSDGFKFLKSLIAMNSKYGVEKYYSLAKENNSIPDYSEDGNICSLTEAIRAVRSLELLPPIIKLLHLLFSTDFKDISSFGLYNSLYSAVKNIAEENYEPVRDSILEVLETSCENMEKRAFCNGVLDEINRHYLVTKDSPWSLKEVNDFFLSNKSLLNG